MENISLKDLSDLVNSGSNLALIACAWFIHKAESRFAEVKASIELLREAINKLQQKE